MSSLVLRVMRGAAAAGAGARTPIKAPLLRVRVAAAALGSAVSSPAPRALMHTTPALSSARRASGSSSDSNSDSDDHERDTRKRVETIATALTLDALDVDLFMAPVGTLWHPPGAKNVFGGQIVGQAMVAAHRTVSAGMAVHSVHAYFLRGGDSSKPAIYHVDRLRDGRSFETRAVTCRQAGKTIFSAHVSFHRPEDDYGYAHQEPMPPDVAPPEELPSAQQNLRDLLADERLDSRFVPYVSSMLESPFPFDVRFVTKGIDPFDPAPAEPRQLCWMRVDPAANLPDSMDLHRCLAAYASDWSLCTTSLLPHGLTLASPRLQLLTSLDHTLWFRRPFRADEWLLYEMDSPQSGGGRGLQFGRIFKRDGELVMTAAQESLMRIRPPKGRGE